LERSQIHKIIGTIPKVWMGIPLIVQGKTIGDIAVQNYIDPDYFMHKHLEVFISVAELIAIAIEWKRIMDAMEKRGRTLSLITDNTSSFVLIINAEGRFEFANSAHRLLDYGPKDLVGKSYFDLIHSDNVENVMDFFGNGMRPQKK
jgi:hypothetical protein